MDNQAKTIPILMYHSISCASNPKFQPFAVSPQTFAEQMAYLHNHHYTPLTVSQFVRLRKDGLPGRPVVLTFDDGYADFVLEGLPILERYRFPATLYIPTSFIGRQSAWMQDIRENERLLLSWEQLMQASKSGMECGAHTHTHPQLDTLPRARAKQEIRKSKSILEDRLGQEITSFAYPFGYFTAQTKNIVIEAGYHSACAVEHALCAVDADPFALKRLLVNDVSLDTFATLLTEGPALPGKAIPRLYTRTRAIAGRVVRRNLSRVRGYVARVHEDVD